MSKVWIALPLAPFRPKLKVLVVTVTHAILAFTTTFPVGELTVIPNPGVLLTDKTACSCKPENSSVKFSWVF